MKRLLVVLLFASNLMTFAQKEWAPVGAKWHYDKFQGMMSSAKGYVLIESIKDSIINDTNVRVLTVTYVKPDGDTLKYPHEYTYSDAGKVYFWKNNQFHLLYNFNAAKDSTWNIFSSGYNACGKDSSGSVIVDSVRIEQINQQSFKCLYVSPGQSSIWEYQKIIEPIGSVYYMFPSPVFCGIADDDMSYFAGTLRCYEDNQIGLINFTFNQACNYITTGISELPSNKIKVYPNPFIKIINIENNEPGIVNSELLILDVYGAIRYSTMNLDKIKTIDLGNLKPGIYIIKILANNRLIYSNKICKI
jgi:hypothetical protein